MLECYLSDFTFPRNEDDLPNQWETRYNEKRKKKKIVDVYLQTPMSRSTENQILDFHIMFSADDKEDSILGSILLPSFHISMLSVDDHISRKYAFKVEKYIYQQLFSVIWACWFLCNVGKNDNNNYNYANISR